MRSRRVLLLVGLVIFAGSTAILCVGTTISLFIAGRILQGMSAAIVWTAGVALLADNVEKEELGKSLGFVSIAMSAGTFLGPLLGGVVYDYGGYYAVYAMAFALIAIDLVLRLVLIEGKDARKYITAIDRQGHDAEMQSITPRRDSGPRNGILESQNLSNQVTWQKRYPPVIWLLGSRRLQVALCGTMVFGIILTGFDAVCGFPSAQFLAFPNSNTRSLYTKANANI